MGIRIWKQNRMFDVITMKRALCAFALAAVALALPAWGSAQTTPRRIVVNFSRVVGSIKALNGVNEGPLAERGEVDLSAYYKALRIKYVRLHDVPWFYDDAVDINYVFPHWSANPDSPSSYNFQLTDKYIQSILRLGIEPIYRFGYSADSQHPATPRNTPPPDLAKWTSVCVHIVRHYNHGWANGFHYNIKYWEIWNEPDLQEFWAGTPEQYFHLYEATAKAVKSADPSVEVGGPTLSNHLGFLQNFLKYSREHHSPLDFLSWHMYSSQPYQVYLESLKVKQLADQYGYSKAQIVLDEWNYFPGDWGRLNEDQEYAKKIYGQIGGIPGAAYDASALVYLQDSPVDIATFYTGSVLWWGLFDSYGIPFKAYYTFKAFTALLDNPVHVAASGSDHKGFAVLAGISRSKSSAAILISNFGTPYWRYKISLEGLPWKGPTKARSYEIDQTRNLNLLKSQTIASLAPALSEAVQTPSVLLIRLKPSRCSSKSPR